jgi:hypothetical protein
MAILAILIASPMYQERGPPGSQWPSSITPLRRFISMAQGCKGRPQKDRYAIACPSWPRRPTICRPPAVLIQRLKDDEQLRRLCGWRRIEQIPHECTFSRVFAEFAAMELGQFVHEGLIRDPERLL